LGIDMEARLEERNAGRRASDALKRAVDVLVSAFALLLGSPFLLVIAVVIRATMGSPILFRQERLGIGGRPFTLYKFRTMTGERDHDGRLLSDADRLTRVGRALRAVALDELPELVNVLLGDMSLVGPRPLLPSYRTLYTAEQWRRHEVRPGIAGPVVARGRNALSWKEKFALDVWYVDHRSLPLDIKLLALSSWRALTREGANQPGRATVDYYRGEEP
jgi:lipopolysaccharide/colanic/teichoic acid biosynthesis glycosyltransferase